LNDDKQMAMFGDDVPFVRQKYKDRGAKPPQTYDLVQEGDNAAYLAFILEARDLPKIDFGDPEQVKERINWYFNHCMNHDMRPTVSGMSNALGVSRRTVWLWKNGTNRPQNFEIINQAYDQLEELWELYMMHGKVNPANAIFLGKNHFGYRDVQDVVVTPNNPLGEVKSAEEIAEQYDYLLTDEDNDE